MYSYRCLFCRASLCGRVLGAVSLGISFDPDLRVLALSLVLHAYVRRVLGMLPQTQDPDVIRI